MVFTGLYFHKTISLMQMKGFADVLFKPLDFSVPCCIVLSDAVLVGVMLSQMQDVNGSGWTW